MRLKTWLLYGLFVSLLLAAAAQTPVFLQIFRLMTPAELNQTGVGSLTQQQRTALDVWLNRYTRQVLQIAATKDAGSYSSTGKHWVDEVYKSGALVVLEDDSLWEIEGTDQVDTNLWLSTTDIRVSKDSSAVGDYKYVLRNTEDKESAHAKYLGTL